MIGAIYYFQNEQEWQDFIKELPEQVTIALIDGAQKTAASFPCVAKLIETVLTSDEGEDIQGLIITFFYKEDALRLLGIIKSDELEGYQYAESTEEGN